MLLKKNLFEKDKNILFFKVLKIYIIFALLNFLLTANPYSALHSGNAGFQLGTVSTIFFISPAYTLLFSVLLIWMLYLRKNYLNIELYMLIITLFLSGIFSNRFIEKPETYIYDITMIILVYSISLEDSLKGYKNINWTKVGNYFLLVLLLGLILVLLFPFRFGSLPFDFSRTSRGEVSLWTYLSLEAIFPSIALILYEKEKKYSYIFATLFMSFIILSTASRVPLIISVLPLFIYIFFRKKNLFKYFFSVMVVMVIILYWENLVEFVTLGIDLDGLDSLESIFTGRFSLWQYHYNKFTENIFFGTGVFVIERFNDYTGSAFSEIGFLKWLTENGIFFGTTIFIVIMGAIKRAISIVKNKHNNYFDLFISLSFLSMLPNLIQSYSRILTIGDFYFWYALFYLYSKKRSRNLDHLN